MAKQTRTFLSQCLLPPLLSSQNLIIPLFPMKTFPLLALVLGLAVTSSAFAGKKNKNPAAPVATASSVMAKYDKNSNGILDDTEKEAIRAALEKDPDLKPFDKNGDGKLDDAELAAIAKPAATTDEGPKKKKKKKDAQ
ncbi:MAG: hypothetical protein JWO94_3378 [Verrucomicrobiaceae bacterium]|nr:hypothetical protein [Verrucomicrobiaceae bacterium]